jgi:hypothetical protein
MPTLNATFILPSGDLSMNYAFDPTREPDAVRPQHLMYLKETLEAIIHDEPLPELLLGAHIPEHIKEYITSKPVGSLVAEVSDLLTTIHVHGHIALAKKNSLLGLSVGGNGSILQYYRLEECKYKFLQDRLKLLFHRHGYEEQARLNSERIAREKAQAEQIHFDNYNVVVRNAEIKTGLDHYHSEHNVFSLLNSDFESIPVSSVVLNWVRGVQAVASDDVGTYRKAGKLVNLTPGRIQQAMAKQIRRWNHPGRYGKLFEIDRLGRGIKYLDLYNLTEDKESIWLNHEDLKIYQTIAIANKLLAHFDTDLKIDIRLEDFVEPELDARDVPSWYGADFKKTCEWVAIKRGIDKIPTVAISKATSNCTQVIGFYLETHFNNLMNHFERWPTSAKYPKLGLNPPNKGRDPYALFDGSGKLIASYALHSNALAGLADQLVKVGLNPLVYFRAPY